MIIHGDGSSDNDCGGKEILVVKKDGKDKMG